MAKIVGGTEPGYERMANWRKWCRASCDSPEMVQTIFLTMHVGGQVKLWTLEKDATPCLLQIEVCHLLSSKESWSG